MHRSPHTALIPLLLALVLAAGCSSTYYSAMETMGIHKRDILVDRVSEARDSQDQARQQFQSALDQFASVVRLENTDLKQAYETLEAEYKTCEKAAHRVSERIDKVEDVSAALFAEWEEELDLYSSSDLRRRSAEKLRQTRAIYDEMISSMRAAEKSMDPVLATMLDNVLFLKHNLNAQAIGSLRGEFASLDTEIKNLITKMNRAIEKSDRFISHLGS